MKNDRLYSKLLEILSDKFGDQIKQYQLPPPIFITMKGEFLDIDLESGSLTVKFPILESYSNPYGAMQGGMIAAAVDNAIGPLSVAMAPPNVTRNLEMKYSKSARPEMEYIIVKARLVEREEPKLYFEADVRSPDGHRLAKGKALHWIISNDATI